MEVRFADKNRKWDGVLMIDGARLKFRNFAGRETDFNREGERNFKWDLSNDPELARTLADNGWNVSFKESNDPDRPYIDMLVKIKYKNGNGPDAYLVTNGKRVRLDEVSIARLDEISIKRVDMDIRPFDWELKSGKTGRTAYLNAIEVVQDIDRFAARYAEEEYPEED